MKIGIVTVPDSANFGSFLQAYALKLVLNKMGHDVSFPATRGKEYVRNIYYNWRPRLRNLKHPIRFVEQNINGSKKYQYFLEDHKKIVIDDEYEQGNYDLFLLGSDEIWNVCTEVFRSPVFYGENMEKVIAYAVSSGKAVYEDFEKYPEIVKRIEQMQDIFARDENTKSIVERITGKECPMVCDPTFFVDWKPYMEDYRDEYLENHKYILIYLYPGSLSKESVRAIKRFAEKKGFKLAAVGLYNGWCDYNVICSPLQFCKVIQKAEYVITATFHGTIFSVLNEKEFVSIGLVSKVEDLLGRLGLSDRLIDKDGVEEQVLEEKFMSDCIDYDKTNQVIAAMREDSIKQLEEVIKKYDNGDM